MNCGEFEGVISQQYQNNIFIHMYIVVNYLSLSQFDQIFCALNER